MKRLSLQMKLILFVLSPITLINVLFAGYGFIYARETLIDLWAKGATVQMQLVAAEIDSRLQEVRSSITAMVMADSIPNGMLVRAFEALRLLSMQGVLFVDISPSNTELERLGWYNCSERQSVQAPLEQDTPMMHACKEVTFRTTVYPLYNRLEIEALVMWGGTVLDHYMVYLSFSSLVKEITNLGMWERGKAMLVTADGRCLASTDPEDNCREHVLGAGDELMEHKLLEEMKHRDVATLFGEGRPPSLVMGYQKVPSTNFYVAFQAKGCDVCKPMLKLKFIYTAGGVAAFGIIFTIVVLSTRSIVKGVNLVVDAAGNVGNGDYSVRLNVDREDEIGKLQRSFNKMVEGLQRTQLIEEAFGRYVDRAVAEELLNAGAELDLGGQEKTVTILKSDLRGFTKTSSKMSPAQVLKLLNRYLSSMISVIGDHKGIIVDFYGDGILVFFDGPASEVKSTAYAAVRCAVAMQQTLKHVSISNQAEGLPELVMAIGIHTDRVIVGNIGSEKRAKYGIVGVGVNLTDRLQSMAVHGGILLSNNTYNLVAEQVRIKKTTKIALEGIGELQDVYEVDSDAV